MSEQPRPQYEKKEEEKEQEKEHEKEDEKRDEKNVEEKWKRDPLGTAIWAAILIWAGLVLLAENLGYLQTWAGALRLGGLQVWNYIFLGAAVLIVVEILIRLAIPTYRRPVLGTAIVALIFFGIGLGDKFGWDVIWPTILIIIGLSILFRGLMPKK